VGDEARKGEYMVLVKVKDDDDAEGDVETWENLGSVEAKSADKARQHFAELHEREGDYVAVPVRSFVPVPLVLERNPRAVVGKR
jgi:hypothetical protein